MEVAEIPAEVHEDASGRFLKVNIEDVNFYIPETSISGGMAGATNLLTILNAEPTFRVLERLLTPGDLGGLEARIDPSDDLVYFEQNQPLFHSFAFDEELSIQRRMSGIGFDPYGKIRINLFLEDSAGFEERVVAIEFDCDYPLVAQLMSPLHPAGHIRGFLHEIEVSNDVLEISRLFLKYRQDNSWKIGLPSFQGGVSTDSGGAFLTRVIDLDALGLFDSGNELLRTAHDIRDGEYTADDWLEKHRAQLSEGGLEMALALDLGL